MRGAAVTAAKGRLASIKSSRSARCGVEDQTLTTTPSDKGGSRGSDRLANLTAAPQDGTRRVCASSKICSLKQDSEPTSWGARRTAVSPEKKRRNLLLAPMAVLLIRAECERGGRSAARGRHRELSSSAAPLTKHLSTQKPALRSSRRTVQSSPKVETTRMSVTW